MPILARTNQIKEPHYFITGFATHVQFLGTDLAFPESKFRDRQLIMAQQVVFGLDALQTSKAITSDVTNPDYDAYFGAIAYKKGGSLCRMIEHFMTEEKFKSGVASYLKTYEYGNAESKDLWASLTQFADLDGNLTISKIMDTWTTQPGFPVITFNGTKISQQRFFLNASGNAHF